MGYTKLFDTVKEKALYDWVYNALGITVIWNNQGGERPSPPFAVLDILSGPQINHTPAFKYKAIDTYTYRFHKDFTLSVSIYALDTSHELVNKLLNSVYLPTQVSTLTAAGIAVYGNADPINVSGLLDTDQELRITIDFMMGYGEDQDDAPGEIQKVTYAGTGELSRINQTVQI